MERKTGRIRAFLIGFLAIAVIAAIAVFSAWFSVSMKIDQASTWKTGNPGKPVSCLQMTTCQEARESLRKGNLLLDGDGDGTPCDRLCNPKGHDR